MTGAPAARRRRVDAVRSVEAILAAALNLVETDTTVNIAAIARAAGVSRVTLYSHFPTREDLLVAVVQRAVSAVAEVLEPAIMGAGAAGASEPVPDLLDRLLRDSWPMLHRYRNLYAAVSVELLPSQLRALHQPIFGWVGDLIARGQRDGDIRSDLAPGWLVAATYALVHLAADEVRAGQLSATTAGDVLTASIRSLLTASDGTRPPAVNQVAAEVGTVGS